uniref:uncharacterized protein isoform X3 n=1 Tax=Lonchura striata TaxID=40157 RepID=UPI0012937B4E|nr:uncharacterized protein LOC116183767 isoform X3 [Lonchura striata domestica]
MPGLGTQGTSLLHLLPTDVPPRATELSGCTGTTQRSGLTMPEQPLDVGDGRMDSVPAKCSIPQPAMGHPAPFAPPELQVGPKGVTTWKEPLAYSTVHNQYLTNLSPLAPVAPGESGGRSQPPGGVDTPFTNPSWIFQAGGHSLQSPGPRDPWRASRSQVPVASAPTTSPPTCGASMTP